MSGGGEARCRLFFDPRHHEKARFHFLTRKMSEGGLSTSLNGLQTRAWGPAFWHVLYCTAANFPPNPSDSDKLRMVNFLFYFWQSLPCGECRKNFSRNTAMGSPAEIHMGIFESRKTLFAWVHTMHDTVSRALGKGSLPFTLQESQDFIESLRAKCHQPSGNMATGETGCHDALNGVKMQLTLRFAPLASPPRPPGIEIDEAPPPPTERSGDDTPPNPNPTPAITPVFQAGSDAPSHALSGTTGTTRATESTGTTTRSVKQPEILVMTDTTTKRTKPGAADDPEPTSGDADVGRHGADDEHEASRLNIKVKQLNQLLGGMNPLSSSQIKAIPSDVISSLPITSTGTNPSAPRADTNSTHVKRADQRKHAASAKDQSSTQQLVQDDNGAGMEALMAAAQSYVERKNTTRGRALSSDGEDEEDDD